MVSRGCPQGGVLSPVLWCLVVDELLARLNRGGVYTKGYVDDICLLAMGKFPNTVQGSYNGPFILEKRGVTSSGCRLIPTRLDLLHS
jgi:hypothetical protein